MSDHELILRDRQEQAILRYRKNRRIRQDIQSVKAIIGEGGDPATQLDELGFSHERFDELLEILYLVESRRLDNEPAAMHYVRYILNQSGCVRELQDYIVANKGLTGRRNGTAFVAAVKAKSDIFDRMIRMGQELGFIHKEPERINFVADIEGKSDEELVELIEAEIIDLQVITGGKSTRRIKKKTKRSGV